MDKPKPPTRNITRTVKDEHGAERLHFKETGAWTKGDGQAVFVPGVYHYDDHTPEEINKLRMHGYEWDVVEFPCNDEGLTQLEEMDAKALAKTREAGNLLQSMFYVVDRPEDDPLEDDRHSYGEPSDMDESDGLAESA